MEAVTSMRAAFLSYCRTNENDVVSLQQDIEELDYEAWIDHELTGGQAWWGHILENIRNCDCFLFALSTESLDSQACKLELGYAISLNKPVLPILIGDVSTNLIPKELSRIQFVDYRQQDKPGFIALRKALASLPEAGSLPDPLPQAPPVPISYLVDLNERIASTTAMSFEQQSALLIELKGQLRSCDRTEDVYSMLHDFRRRSDLLASVAQEIDDILELQDKGLHGTHKPHPRGSGSERTSPATGTTLVLDDAVQSITSLVEHVQETHECWEIRADAETFATISTQNNRILSKVVFSEYYNFKTTKLRSMGWEYDYVRFISDAIAMALVMISLGTLLLHVPFRVRFRQKLVKRSWPASNTRNMSFDIAQTLISALRAVTPHTRNIELHENTAPDDSEKSWAEILGGH